MESLDIAKIAALAAHDKKSLRTLLYDLGKHAPMCDYMLVCSGTNEKQTVAIADAIQAEVHTKSGVRPTVVEGKQTGQWIVMDYGSLIVHIFFDYVRDFYAIEKLWPSAATVKLNLD